jgi:hypothetical protein
MILVPSGPEVRAETASGPGRNAGGAQECNSEPAEGVTACPDPTRGRATFVERSRVDRLRESKEARRVSLVDRVGLLRRKLGTVERLRDDVVDQQSLHDFHDVADVAG